MLSSQSTKGLSSGAAKQGKKLMEEEGILEIVEDKRREMNRFEGMRSWARRKYMMKRRRRKKKRLWGRRQEKNRK